MDQEKKNERTGCNQVIKKGQVAAQSGGEEAKGPKEDSTQPPPAREVVWPEVRFEVFYGCIFHSSLYCYTSQSAHELAIAQLCSSFKEQVRAFRPEGLLVVGNEKRSQWSEVGMINEVTERRGQQHTAKKNSAVTPT